MGDWLFLVQYKEVKSISYVVFYGICYLLIALVTYGRSTPGIYYVHDVVPPKRACGEEFMADAM